MKLDRIIALVAATVCCVVANVLPTSFPQTSYGRGVPLKWTYDPVYDRSGFEDKEPYRRNASPPEYWKFDGRALAVDIAVALAIIGLALALNEIAQISCGNRPAAIPPHA